MNSFKDSVSFALGVESAVGIFNQNSQFKALDKPLIVEGFQTNLSDSQPTECGSTLALLLGMNGTDFNSDYIKEGSTCIGRMTGFYLYNQMKEIDQLQNIDLDFVNVGFKQAVFEEDTQSLSSIGRTQVLKQFAQIIQRQYLAETEKNDAIFWKEVLRKPNIEQIGETGIYFETIKKGSGGKPTEDSDFEAHYILTDALGDTLESSYAAGQSLKMNLSMVIDGWKQGFPALEKGGEYILYVPFEKAYKGNLQAPQGALCFFIEFIDFGPKGTIAPPPPTFTRRKH